MNDNRNKQSAAGGIGFCGLLAVTFIVLKLTGIIGWSWLWVLAPLWIPAAITIAIILIVLVVAVVKVTAQSAGSHTSSRQNGGPAMNKSTCRGCGAPIIWIKTPGGKSMPCDPSPVYYKPTPGGKDKVVTARGEVISCEIVPGADATDAGYRPHWATCPQAGNFKRGGSANGER